MLDLAARRHADFVMRSVGDGLPGQPGFVARSWHRCINDYSLDPAGAFALAGLSRDRLEACKERNAHLLASARSEAHSLYRQLPDRDTLVVIADADGTVLETLGDGVFVRQAARIGMCPGSDWSERACGTNGIGTSLAERRPLVIDRAEHFFPSLIGLSCCAAPIFDECDALVGVLDVTSESDLSAEHFRMLIGMSANTIENRLFEARHGHLHLVRLHSRRELLHTFHEGLVALDGGGTVVAANRSATLHLGRAGLVGRNARDVLETGLDELLGRAAESAGYPLPLTAAGGRSIFVHMKPPRRGVAARRAEGRAVATTAPRRDWGDLGIERDFARAARVYEKGIYVLLQGETGCGKEVFARALHEAGARAGGPFVAVNCAALPETLIESELFGYRGGAFTGASREGRRGRILAADEGTLLLDEIGDMPLALQARLLRVLEEKEVTPLGGETAVKVDVRVICATHRDLPRMVAEGSFRRDLYFRLAGFAVELPPLRLRGGRAGLIRALLAELAPGATLSPAALDCLAAYHWPGNLRQLRNVLETVVALAGGATIGVADLPPEIGPRDRLGALPEMREPPPHDDVANEGEGAELSCLEQAAREAMLRLLERHRWNITRVADELGVSRNTVYRKVERYRLVRD
ncbi:MAG: sigma-54-dependent Fis family transcriptional regulator [Rhodocyclaceae bacterium]|nr:sigma-54-dependent Fis family transcriptional regulator [Rhodocyclaceae bacterium]MBK9310403.1 sigma-54-dependent Fis family transcriptional regulator [Rhodocyclaceae bacterium]MBK9954525.1 sigma-54-dependent Fis family transcriptional regulator [Rhodocyclaceae bacterium]